ncbi:ATP synthase F1 subunit gamma [Pseudobacteroides cellulosolvens]|uniref:ATP synthase gamma chain n=1 Tax=Pseudobacteroides cellulosolvens ATCC 35603 = DSM 2933 TaxID=398512 RepID=A0A0L6JRY1_9FIRM|nr:ATP synthase F1 subunit gamma [Pseudobacteroides cellulosolvens]KNY28509.1 ATP synthase gamma chain [Pseudobacteroides cellulosolvens ATCC 35603 = DSM 2933]
MANMREIKSRIKSIKETRQITKAMKLISAAKLKKARQQLDQTKPFFDKVRATIGDILMHSGNLDNIFFDLRNEKEGKKKCYVIITGDKGLAGGYNHNIIKLSEGELKKHPDSLLLVAGHMGRGHFVRKKYNVDMEFDYPVQNPTIYRARDVAEKILGLFKSGEVDEVFLIYTKMVTSITLEPVLMQLLPLTIEDLREDVNAAEVKIDESLAYEPSPQAVFDVLIPKYVKGIIYGALVEAFTSEQNARMSAMDNATTNADEMLKILNLNYNRARQAAITQEISEIVGGAAALS